VVNLCELYAGAYGSRDPQKELRRVQDLVSNLGLLELDAGAARRYGDLVNDPALKREPIGAFDLIIASIALEQNEKLSRETSSTSEGSRDWSWSDGDSEDWVRGLDGARTSTLEAFGRPVQPVHYL
jgi:hypothetical protein